VRGRARAQRSLTSFPARMTDPHNMQEAEVKAAEPVSPELVLVDPQLAAHARARLRAADEDLSWLANHRPAPTTAATAAEVHENGAGSSLAVSETPFAARAPALEHAEADTSVVQRRRRGRRALLAVSAALTAAAIGVLVFPPDVIDTGGSTSARTLTPAPPRAARSAKQTHRARQRSQPSRAPARATRSHSTKPTIQPRKRQRRARASRFPVQVFVWPPVSRAAFYKVEFFRKGRKVFEAFPRKPRIELPRRWVFRGRQRRLTAGTYRWNVRPAFGSRARPRFGKLITQSTWLAR
jgi:hypothetical protein